MRALITGADGQLGKDLHRHCARAGDQVVAASRQELDITDHAAVSQLIRNGAFDVVYNCAAWTAVDACEADPARALAVNGRAVDHLALACADAGSHLVQLSTDYVFDGQKSGAYVESDSTNPLNVYGKSKARGERAAGPHATVARTSWLFSSHGNNAVATIMRLARQGNEMRFVTDQTGRPTFTDELAVALRLVGHDRVPGVVHLTNQTSVSWFEFAQLVVAQAGFDPAVVVPVLTADLEPSRAATRPANSVLANTRHMALGYPPLGPVDDAVAAVVAGYGNDS